MGSSSSSGRGSLKRGYKNGDNVVENDTNDNGRDKRSDLGSINEATTISFIADSDDEKNEPDQILVTDTLNKKTLTLRNNCINCNSDIKENVTSGRKYVSTNAATLKEKHRERYPLKATECIEKQQQIMHMFAKSTRSPNCKCLLENGYQVLTDIVQDKHEKCTHTLFECALLDGKVIAEVIDNIEERKNDDEEEADTDMVIIEYEEEKHKCENPT